MTDSALASQCPPSICYDIAQYLSVKHDRLTPDTYNTYRYCLTKLIPLWHDLSLDYFEPPAGAGLIEECLDLLWSESAPRTYNRYLSIVSDFFRFEVTAGRLQRDPTPLLVRARVPPIYRTTFSRDQCRAILAAQRHLPDRIAVRLLLTYGLRKASLQAIRFGHFDSRLRRLEIFANGLKIGELPIPQETFWLEVEQYIVDAAVLPNHYLLCRHKTIPVGPPDPNGRRRVEPRRFPEQSLSGNGMHLWWYKCLANADIVANGVTHGQSMHKARHTAGQQLLDKTGNLKAVQALLCHSSISTTDCMYPDWDIDDLATTMAQIAATDAALSRDGSPVHSASRAHPRA